MTVSKYQVSSKLPDGRIFVIGGDTYADFKSNLGEALGSVDAEGLLTTMASSLVSAPTSVAAAVANLAPLGVTPAPTQTFTPSTAPVSRACKHGSMQTRTQVQGLKAHGRHTCVLHLREHQINASLSGFAGMILNGVLSKL